MSYQFSKLDFVPARDDWNIDWPGPPRRAINYADVKFYTVSIELKNPVARATRLTFDLVSGGHVLGDLVAEFDAGSRTPRDTKYARCVAGEAVPGTPSAPYEGGFWLGCTKLGRVKGNGIKDDDGRVNLYLQLLGGYEDRDGRWVEFTVRSSERVKSPKHGIRCVG